MKMKVAILSLHLLICVIGAEAQTLIKGNVKKAAAPAHISVELKGYKTGKDSIAVTFWKDHIYGDMLNGSTEFWVKPDKNGKFKINLPAMDHPGRVSIFDWVYELSIVRLQLVEPGDNIQVAIQVPESDTEEPVLKFSGKGAAKYECSKGVAMHPMTDYQTLTNSAKDYHLSLQSADSLLQAKLNVLDRSKDKLSSLAYRIMTADVKGDVYLLMSTMMRLQATSNREKGVNGIQEQKLQEAFKELQTRVDTMDKEALVLSINYTKFLYDLAKGESVLLDDDKNYEFKKVYDKLRNYYSGALREKLLAYAVFNSWDLYTFFLGIDPDVYSNCLKDVLALTKKPHLKEAIKKRLDTRGKGATALNFTLPADSSGRLVSLSDLKGKVVLVDMWAYNCTACHLFFEAFHEKVYPVFKDNPDFAVVSIMLDAYAGKDRYMQRLRGDDNFTSTKNINLYAGKGIAMEQLISTHYNIDAVPFLLLVDKDGKVYSSTLPFFTGASNSQKIGELTALIKKALAAKSGS